MSIESILKEHLSPEPNKDSFYEEAKFYQSLVVRKQQGEISQTELIEELRDYLSLRMGNEYSFDEISELVITLDSNSK